MQACQGALVLLFLSALGSAQVAPGDEDDRCYSQVVSTYPANKPILMSSNHYLTLLGSDGVWDQIDLDDHDTDSTFNPTFFRQNAGGLCRWSVMSCGWRSSDQNYWQDNYLFTQFISKAAPPNTNHNIRVVVDIQYTLSSCRKRLGCNPKFELLKFETSGPQPREVYTDVTNYQSIRIKTGSSAASQSLVENIGIPENIEGLYLAVRDNRSCIQVAKMQVYRYQCNSKQEGLVIFPETAAPMSSNMTVTAQCAPHSYPVTHMDVVCTDNGQWSGSGQCRCNPGYYRQTGIEGDYCSACPIGYYRTDTDPEDECIYCPANTEVNIEGAPECSCLVGYFRNNEGLDHHCPASQREENVSFNCTAPPSYPLHLLPVGSTISSLNMSWETPYDSGGRSDLYYRVLYSDPVIHGVMIEANCTQAGCLTETVCTIQGLQPATRYFIQVSAHNGVSDQDEGGALARMSDITMETDIAPPSAVEGIEAFCEVVVWEEPAVTNGEILYYGLMFYYSNGSENVFYVPGDKCFFIISSFYEQNMSVQIFAENKAGPGPYSSVDLPECPWLFPYPSPSPLPIIPTTPSRPPEPSTVCVTSTETVVSTETTTLNIPVPTSVLVTVPTVTDCITSTTTSVVTSTVVSTSIAPTPSPVVIEVPTTVTSIATITTTETSHSTATATETVTTTATTTVVPEPSRVVVTVPTTIVTTATETDYITTTTTNTVTTTATTSIVIEPSPVVFSTTVTETTTETDSVTATTTALVTTCPPIQTPEPTQLPTCPEPTPCDSCCEECEECNPPSPCPTPDEPTAPPADCPSCPTITFYGSANCAQPKRKPGNVRNVHMLNCGMIVWDAPEDASCCRDHITYKVRFYNGTSYSSTGKSHRKVMRVNTSWVKFTAADLPTGRPLQVMVKARKQDGVHSKDWVNAGSLTDSYVMDCPPFN